MVYDYTAWSEVLVLRNRAVEFNNMSCGNGNTPDRVSKKSWEYSWRCCTLIRIFNYIEELIHIDDVTFSATLDRISHDLSKNQPYPFNFFVQASIRNAVKPFATDASRDDKSGLMQLEEETGGMML